MPIIQENVYEPIGIILDNRYEVYITEVFSDNPNYIFNGMRKPGTYQVNSNELLKLTVGDSFNER